MARYVYIIEAENGLFKIGCSKFPAERLKVINLHSPIPARLIAMWDGDGFEEQALHRQFHEQRAHNEWFRPDGPVVPFVEANRGRGVEAIATWDEVARPGRERAKADLSARLSALAKAHWAARKAKPGGSS